jgi:hypothetical protein
MRESGEAKQAGVGVAVAVSPPSQVCHTQLNDQKDEASKTLSGLAPRAGFGTASVRSNRLALPPAGPTLQRPLFR